MTTRRRTCEGPAWKEVAAIPQGEDGRSGKHHLLNALLTTYEMPDSRVLVENLLPEWLGLGRPFVEDSSDGRYLFFAEIDRALKALRGHLHIFCSPPVGIETTSQSYPWIFRHLRCFRVGRTGPAVQHAKLWMFHWGGERGATEFLELVISSCNLTDDALKGQLQAGWRAKMPLGNRPSHDRLRGWGVLPAFLDALARSSAGDAKAVSKRWSGLLSRATPPADVVFLASVPGRHSRTELRSLPWGMAGLRSAVPSSWTKTEVDILVPSIGLWRAESIGRWAAYANASSGSLRLAWPPSEPTTQFTFPMSGMSLPPGTLKSFEKAGVAFLAWPSESEAPWRPLLHPQHRQSDRRWPHCKLYWIGRRSRRESRLLVTSANLSNAAWGRWHGNSLQVDNFELGVAFSASNRPLLKLAKQTGRPYVGGDAPERATPLIAWAEACWDGLAIRLDLRLDHRIRPSQIGTTLLLDGHRQQPARSLKWTRIGKLHHAKFSWRVRNGVPIAVNLVIAASSPTVTVVPVADRRPDEDVLDTPCPEIPSEWLRDVEIRMILERYGGRIADAEEPPLVKAMPPERDGDGKVTSDFRVEVIEAARRNWRVIDAWRDAMMDGGESRSTRLLILRDGRGLRDHWLDVGRTKKAKNAEGSYLVATLAARELDFRIRRVSK